MLVDVALPLPIESTFSYLVPEDWQTEITPGHRVVVSFGPRTLTGVVVAQHEPARHDQEEHEYKFIDDIPDDRPALTPELLDLTRWIADYYVCGWGEAIRAALPPGIEIQSESTVERTDRPLAEAKVSGASLEILRYLEGRGAVPVSTVRRKLPAVSTAHLRRLERDDFVHLSTRIKAPRASVRMTKFVSLHPRVVHSEDVRTIVGELRGSKQKAVAAYLLEELEAGEAEVEMADVLEETKASSATVRSLIDKGVLEVNLREDTRSGFAEASEVQRSQAPSLHAEQREALDELQRSLDGGKYAAFLLQGVTGSGKTEVYLAALANALARGKGAIILVPEIALTPQMVGRFRSRFGDEISVLHSRMSIGERFDAWRALRDGRHRIV
ncbi:MAG: DEAD/DEAH box helicase family protein, partial [Rhodothermales bacterium]|nr:DEAD/DEAH box helicase family protein [Rhodothermales bacterium]